VENGNAGGNGQGGAPVQIIEPAYRVLYEPHAPAQVSRKRPFLLALILFVLTVISTLAVGVEFSVSYTQNHPPFFGLANPFAPTWHALMHPRLLLLGIPFSFTLIGILLAHELGHYFACRYYKIDASYPYFMPAPSLIGTFGAFIRIRSPIFNRKALFDVGFSGPLVGFILTVPILAFGISISKVLPNAQAGALVKFGSPPLMKFFLAVFHPGVSPQNILLSPIALAAWVGLFATALNLLPIGQLDGGHILYGVASSSHRRISIAFGIALVVMGIFFIDWLIIAALFFFLGFRHPPLIDSWTPLDATRRAWAVVALIIFLLCFTPIPIAVMRP
jgi:membrane-associated protease RseP (regulator of RpoE activity)